MMANSSAHGRRVYPRASALALCTEHGGPQPRSSMVTDLSEWGLRLQRPVGGRRPEGLVPLEFEIPEVDEIVWAAGEVCFDEVWQVRGREFGLSGLLRTSGIRLVSMTARHRRMLRDFSHAYAAPVPIADPNPLMFASCYTRG